MEEFDPVDEKRHLEAVYGVPACLGRDVETWRQDRALGGGGEACLQCAISCLLVGWIDPVPELLTKAREWLSLAIQEREIPRHYFPGSTEADLHQDLARCNWLLQNEEDVDNLKAAIDWRSQYYRGRRLDQDGVRLALVDYVDAKAYQELLALFAAARLQPPTSADGIRDEGSLAYMVARHHVAQEYSDEDIHRAIDATFRDLIPECLSEGDYSRVTRWMKCAFWQPGMNAASSLLRCYDYLPGLQAPELGEFGRGVGSPPT